MQCIVCGQEVPIGSPAPNLCSTPCVQAHQRAQEGPQVPDDVKAILREHGTHTAACARRAMPTATCTCALGRHSS